MDNKELIDALGNKKEGYCSGCSFKCQATECECTCHDRMREKYNKEQVKKIRDGY